MTENLPTWLLLMILASLALTNANSSFHLKHHQGDVNLSRPILQGHEAIHGVLGTVRLNGSDKDYGKGSNKEQEDLVVLGKGQRGKIGVSDGGGAASRPQKSAAPRPYLIEKTMLHVSFSLVLLIVFKLL